jgi:hypothetical protein
LSEFLISALQRTLRRQIRSTRGHKQFGIVQRLQSIEKREQAQAELAQIADEDEDEDEE